MAETFPVMSTGTGRPDYSGNLWVSLPPEEIMNQAILAPGVFNTDSMVDCRNVKRVVFKVDNTLDQPLIMQIIGNQVESFVQTVNIGPPVPCLANGQTSIGLAWDDCLPWVGATITVAVAPTVGLVKVWDVVQE